MDLLLQILDPTGELRVTRNGTAGPVYSYSVRTLPPVADPNHASIIRASESGIVRFCGIRLDHGAHDRVRIKSFSALHHPENVPRDPDILPGIAGKEHEVGWLPHLDRTPVCKAVLTPRRSRQDA
jgi:hypothetical protein